MRLYVLLVSLEFVTATFQIPLSNLSMIEITLFRGESGQSITRPFQVSLFARSVVIVNATDEPFSAISVLFDNRRVLYADENFVTAYSGETPEIETF